MQVQLKTSTDKTTHTIRSVDLILLNTNELLANNTSISQTYRRGYWVDYVSVPAVYFWCDHWLM